MGEAADMVRETIEADYLATVQEGDPEPKPFKEAQRKHEIVLISQIGGKLCVY
jgi:hypothetical protein